jgi:hypothetical protein
MADRKRSEEFRLEITGRLSRDECVGSKAWQIEHTERMSNTGEERIPETPDSKKTDVPFFKAVYRHLPG